MAVKTWKHKETAADHAGSQLAHGKKSALHLRVGKIRLVQKKNVEDKAKDGEDDSAVVSN